MVNTVFSRISEIRNDKRFVSRKFDLAYDIETILSREESRNEEEIEVRN